MTQNSYRKKVRNSLRKLIKKGQNINSEKTGNEKLEEETEILEDSKKFKYSRRIQMNANEGYIDHIISRIYSGRGEILFAHRDNPSKYDYLGIELTELGYVPTKFATPDGKEYDLFSMISDGKDPYENIFKSIQKYFENKGSEITRSYLLNNLYFDLKSKMVEKGMDKDLVYFIEKRTPYKIILNL